MIESAASLFHRQGYTATGAREIAAVAGVPPGSFTNHFRSKEGLASAALDRYFARLGDAMRKTLGDRSRPAGERLSAYFDLIGGRLAEAGWQHGCLIPDLATEASAFGDALRDRLADVMREQVAAFQAVLDELAVDTGTSDLATFIVAAWHGTLLRMKVERSAEPVERFERVLRTLIPSARHQQRGTVGHGHVAATIVAPDAP